ncbi:hypothetical protein [Nonomuraea longicatena]|uniref:Uncharacterized protein n=1 Tax=Nonomuraea longicatena TaxID=83682 RepID=A0ABN1PUX8_9ACTN
MESEIFGFAFDALYRRPLWLLGITPESSGVVVVGGLVRVRFGPWKVETELSNIEKTAITGPYSAAKAIGVRISAADRGLTFGTNVSEGLCLSFQRPVRGGEPAGLIRHPALTVTVADPQSLAERLDRTSGTKPCRSRGE